MLVNSPILIQTVHLIFDKNKTFNTILKISKLKIKYLNKRNLRGFLQAHNQQLIIRRLTNASFMDVIEFLMIHLYLRSILICIEKNNIFALIVENSFQIVKELEDIS